MKRCRVRRRCLVSLLLVSLPPLFWALVLAVTPTEWARSRIVASLSEASRRPVHLGGVRIGALGGIHLTDLRIGTPGGSDNPWLKVGTARINVSLLQLLAGQMDPSEVVVDGLSLRVWRRRDGTLELADLLRANPSDPEARSRVASSANPTVVVRIRDAQITVLDEPSGTKLELTEVGGIATSEGRIAAIRDLHGLVNGGRFELAASLDRGAPQPAFEGKLHAEGVELGEGTNVLAYLVPMLSVVPGDGPVEGRMDANLYVRGAGTSRATLRRSLVGQGTISLDPLELQRSRFLAELARMIDLPEADEAGSLKSEFTIKDGRVTTSDLTMVVAKFPIVMAGWTDFDGRIDYRVRSENLADRLPGQARDLLSELNVPTADLAGLRLQGTLDDMDVSSESSTGEILSARPGTDPNRRGVDRARARDLGRRVRDRLLR